jgi:hypothetical protein
VLHAPDDVKTREICETEAFGFHKKAGVCNAKSPSFKGKNGQKKTPI